jgi:hypothetical protein
MFRRSLIHSTDMAWKHDYAAGIIITAYAADTCCCRLPTLLLLLARHVVPTYVLQLIWFFTSFFLPFHLPFQRKQDVEFSIQGDRELNMEHCLEILLPSSVIKKKICHSAY